LAVLYIWAIAASGASEKHTTGVPFLTALTPRFKHPSDRIFLRTLSSS